MDAQLAVEILPMSVHRVAGDEELLFDIAHIAPAGKKGEDLRLPFGEAMGHGNFATALVQRLMGEPQKPRREQKQRALRQDEHEGDDEQRNSGETDIGKQIR